MATPLTQQIIDSDPDIQAYVRGTRSNSGWIEQSNRGRSELMPLLQRKGYVVPEGMSLNPKTGRLEEMGGGFDPLKAAGVLIPPLAIGLSGAGKTAANVGQQVVNKASGGSQMPTDGQKKPPTESAGEKGNGGKTVAAILGLAGLLGSRAMRGNGQADLTPQMQQLAQIGVDRANAQTPLFNATNQGLYSMLPNFAKGGSGMTIPQTGLPSPPMTTSQTPNGGGMPWWLPVALGAGGFALSDILHGKVPFETIINALRKIKPFGGGDNAGVRDYMNQRQAELGMGGQEDYGTGGWVPGAADYGSDAGTGPWVPGPDVGSDAGTGDYLPPVVTEDVITSTDLL